MIIPGWVPGPLKTILEQMSVNPACTGRRTAVFKRLVENAGMKPVYRVFLQKDRVTGHFKYPARNREIDQSPDDAQFVSIRRILQLTVSIASDRLSVSKIEEIEQAKQRWSDDAARLRMLAQDMELAAEFGMLGINDSLSRTAASFHRQALLGVANWLDHLRSVSRQPGDPLIVERHRGDPVVRAVQISIGNEIEAQLGDRLDGTAATLAGIALDAETTPRASRSALAKRKPKKKRSTR